MIYLIGKYFELLLRVNGNQNRIFSMILNFPADVNFYGDWASNCCKELKDSLKKYGCVINVL